MSAVECHVCTAETDTYLCNGCTAEIEKALAELPALVAELEVTVTRQDRGTGTPLYAMRRQRLQLPGLHYDEGSTTLPATPWPLSWDAASLQWAVGNTVNTWARHLLESRGIEIPTGPACVVCTHRTCQLIRARRSGYALLLLNLGAIRMDEAAAQIHDELTSLAKSIERAIDRQDPDIFAGPCDSPDVRVIETDGMLTPTVSTCGADLYAHLGDAEVKCEACGAVYDLKARKRDMVKNVDDEWARPQLIADALTTLNEPVNASTLRTWIERDAKLAERLRARGGDASHQLILQVGIDDDEHALYRVGDVRARIAAMKSARPERITA